MARIKSYKDLSPRQEIEYVLWLDFFEDSVHNAYVQKKRWKDTISGWDLQMFFVAIVCADDAAIGLKRFLSHDNEVWTVLKKFRKEVKQYQIRELRNDIVHRDNIAKLQDKKGNPLPNSPILLLGVYNATTDEYSFGIHRVKVSKIFDLIDRMTHELRKLLSDRLMNFYKTAGDLKGMIPFTHLRNFPGDGST